MKEGCGRRYLCSIWDGVREQRQTATSFLLQGKQGMRLGCGSQVYQDRCGRSSPQVSLAGGACWGCGLGQTNKLRGMLEGGRTMGSTGDGSWGWRMAAKGVAAVLGIRLGYWNFRDTERDTGLFFITTNF